MELPGDDDAASDTAGQQKKDAAGSVSDPIVVGIGASAGGLGALRKFFSVVPNDTDIAFVVVVHLSPEHESHLAELLQSHVEMPVRQVSGTTALRGGHVYVIPPGRNLSTIDTHLRLTQLESKRRERAPIDHFFRTLAKTHDGEAVGIVLTGTGSDGTLGLKEIKERGGLTIVQDPNEAEYDGMPQSAIATGVIDLILPLATIPDAIQRYLRVKPQLPVPEEGAELEADTRRLLHKILAQLRARTDRDFSRYKRSTVMRRIQRRMQLCEVEDLATYLDVLRENVEEVRLLADDLLITVTNFFRDSEVFAKLVGDTVPSLFAAKGPEDDIRIWCVGCATGEEAYSFAMLLCEEASRRDVVPRIQIFASDLHERSLERAREGFYPGDIDTDVDAARLQRFFVAEEGGYRIRKELREMVVFAPHNLLSDPPFSRLDLVACRNVLIYLQRDVQRDVIELFHYALEPGGYLVLGTSETVDSGELFQTVDKKACIHRKRNVPVPEPRLPVFPVIRSRTTSMIETQDPPNEPIAYGLMHQRMVERYAPPSLLISPDEKVVHLSEHAGRYLHQPGGEPTLNVFKLIRPELRIELRSVLHSVRERREGVRSREVAIVLDGQPRQITLHVRPQSESQHEGFVLVMIDETDPPGLAPDAEPTAADHRHHVSIRELETELALIQQRLQSVIEEYETSREEMKASNEELQSANEELRSTMEELETSKEELQSMNEELQKVNQENRHKVEELAQLSGDLQNLLAATDIATLFLDRNMRILRFTPKVSKLFNVRMTDRHRPLTDLTHRLGYDALHEDARKVLEDLVPLEREVEDRSGNFYLTRILPYRSGDDRIEGVVITFIDITARRRAEQDLKESGERLRLLLDSTSEAIYGVDKNGQCIFCNPACMRMLGYGSEKEVLGKDMHTTIHHTRPNGTKSPGEESLVHSLFRDGKSLHLENELLWRADGSSFAAECWAQPIRRNGELEGAVVTFVDISQRKQTELRLRESEQRLRLAAEVGGFGTYDFDILAGELIWCEQLQAIFGYKGKMPVPLTMGLERVHPEDRQRVEASVKERMTRPEDPQPAIDFRIIRPDDGEVRWVRDIGKTYAEEQQGERRAVRAIGTIRDITDERASAESLEKAVAAAEAANRSRGEFLANMSHEIRTPMTAILGHAEILNERLHEEEELYSVATIRQNGHYLLELINDILDLSKIDAGRMEVEFERISLSRMLSDIRSLMLVRASEKNLQLDVAQPEGGPDVIETDAVRLRQILFNLIGNAIKFTEQGTVRVVVSHQPARGQVQFEVTDTGVGIDSSDLERLFEPFTQADASATRSFGGTGLGLSISRRLARALGGDIHVQSTAGKGSVFTLTIQSGTSAESTASPPPVKERRGRPDGHQPIGGVPSISGRILVVEDRRDIRYLTKHFITRAGGAACFAVHGKDALETIERLEQEGKPVDLVLMDMQMPVMDGYEAVTQLRARGFEKPIIALTAHAMESDRMRCFEVGCNDYAAKPLDGPMLVRLLGQYLPSEQPDAST